MLPETMKNGMHTVCSVKGTVTCGSSLVITRLHMLTLTCEKKNYRQLRTMTTNSRFIMHMITLTAELRISDYLSCA